MTTADVQVVMENPEFRLAAEFPPASRADWLKLVSTVLKGASFEEKLVSSKYGGLHIEALYSGKRDAEPVPGRVPGAPWQILQHVDHPNAAAANEQARQDLANGATGLWVVLAGSTGADGYGIDPSETVLDAIFDGIEFGAGFPIELDSGAKGINAARAFRSLLRRRAISPASVDLRFGFDPLSAIAIDGGSSRPWKELGPELAGSARDLVREGFRGPFAVADGRSVHAAAGSETQELAFALSSALTYLRSFESAGIRLEEARQMIFFRLAADADELLTIAKFRALRRLWARIEASCGLDTEFVFVSAETAWRMLTTRDPWMNILRATTAVFAAGVGGANAISVLPFTAALGLADASARRIARNTQLILVEEANLAKVTDPAAGSGAIEDLTGQLCRIAWAQVQEIEFLRGTRGGPRSRLHPASGGTRSPGARKGGCAPKGRGHRDEPIPRSRRAPRFRPGCRPSARTTFCRICVRAAAAAAALRALRTTARTIRSSAVRDRSTAEGVSRQSRTVRCLQRTIELGEEFVRGRRHRSHCQ